jgi:hypothetical protein
MNENEKQLLDEKFDTICEQMIRIHEENLELKKRLEELENKVERRWQAQQKARQKIFKMAQTITNQFLKSMNIHIPLLNFPDSNKNNNLLVEFNEEMNNSNHYNINNDLQEIHN